MPNNPTVSKRRWIARLPSPPSEPTSTLVLTSRSGIFVDIRLALHPPLTPLQGQAIDWAFAGKATTTPATSSRQAHAVWSHWIDTNVALDQEADVDEGDMMPYTPPEGEKGDEDEDEDEDEDVELELEAGKSVDKVTGEVREYQELWEMLRVRGVEEEKGRKRVCVVLKTGEECERDVRGCVVRVGEWCQGLLKRADGRVTAERWIWQGKEKGWENVFKQGKSEMLACGAAMRFEERDIKEGDVLDVGGIEWTAKEVTLW